MADPFTIEHFEEYARRLILDNGDPWVLQNYQCEFYDDLFKGASENWFVVPEGNGKTTMVAGLGIYAVRFAQDAMIPVAASTRDQARIMYRQAKGLLRRSKLDEDGLTFEAFDGYRRIDLRAPGKTKRGDVLGSMEIHAADAGSGDGVIPYPYAFLDELHRHRSLELYQTWRGKLGKRGAQLVAISTAGSPGSEFEEMREAIRESGEVERKGSRVRSRSSQVLMHDWSVPLDADVDDMAVVKAANPFDGVTVERLREKRDSPTMTFAHWQRFTCNIAAETAAEPFIDAAVWALLGDGDEIEPQEDICIGADGSRTWDTTVVGWATMDGDRTDVDCRVFSVRPEVSHHVLHQGGKIDFDDVEGFLVDLFDRFSPRETAYDPRYLERSMELVDDRLPSSCIFPVEPSSKHMRDAYQAFYTAVVDGRLRHRGDPVVAAHLANCTVDRDERTKEIRRLRKIDPRKPIDAVPALAMAVWRATSDVGAADMWVA